jgi:hypothetical protein
MRHRATAALARAGSVLGVGGGRWSPDLRRASWARPLSRVEDAPGPFAGPLAGYADTEGRLPGAVLTPSFLNGRVDDVGRKVVVSPPGEIHVLEDAGGAILVQRLAIERIHHVRVGTVLLRSWIGFGGTDDDGRPIDVHFEFNTVTLSLFSELLDTARSGEGPAGRGDGRAAVEAAALLPRKFGGYAARSVRGGDRARAAAAQPEVVAAVPGRWWARRVVTPAHLAVLTEREMTIVGDDPAAVRVTRTRHGAVWDHLRLDSIDEASIAPAADGMVRLHLGLPGGRVVESLFEESRREALEALLAAR